MSETMFPSAKIEDTNIPEERRLFYVVATRAKERLIFCSPSYKQSYNGDMESLEISCFIKELDESLYEWTGLSRNTILKSGYIPSYGGWSGGASRRNGPSNYGTWSNSRRNKSWW
jgi:hypothetical protein